MANIKAIITAHLSQRQRAINKQVERAEILDEDRLLCRIIRVAGNIDVPNKPGFVWCQEYSPSNDTNPFHAFNSEVQAREGLDVWIEEGMGGRREVTKWNNATIVNTANYAAQKYLPTHHSDHEWPDFKPGPDVVNVYPRSLSMLRTYPGEGGALTISASSLRYIKGNVLVIFPGKNSLDISAAQPASGLARYVGIYLDPDDNTLKSVNGATTGDSPVITPNSPAFPESAILSANVRLNGDQTTFSEVDMVDIRQILDSSGAIDGTRVSKLVSPDGSVDPAFETDNSGLLSNTTTHTYVVEGSTISAHLFIANDATPGFNAIAVNRTADGASPHISLLRDRAGGTAVVDNDELGHISFLGHDGTDFVFSADIAARVNGAVSSDTVPMELDFQVSATDTSGLETRLRLAPTVVDIGGVGGEDVDIDFNDEQMFLEGSTGRFGVATTGPDAKVDILDNTGAQLRLTHTDGSKFVDFTLDTNHDLTIKPSATGQIKLQPTTDSTDFFQVLDDGGTPVFDVDSTNKRVGLNTASPWRDFSIADATAGAFPAVSIGENSAKNFVFSWSVDDEWANLATVSHDYPIRIGPVSVGGLYIDTDTNSGNVGIGVIPSTKFDVGPGAIEGEEMTAPGAGAANTYRLFAEDNGAGKTRAMIQFSSGAAVQIAIQP